MVGWALRLVRNREDAEDAVQDAFVRMIPAWKRSRPVSVQAWARVVLKNLCLDRIRHRAVIPATLPLREEDFRLPVDAENAWMARLDVEKARRSLPPIYRAALEEELLGVPPATPGMKTRRRRMHMATRSLFA